MTPFVDLLTQFKTIQADVEEAVLAVLRSGLYIQGPQVIELEERLMDYVGARHAVSCASGTDALVIALMASGIGAGDAVFVPSFTFVATAEAVALVGATPVFVDIRPDTFNIDPQRLATAVRALREFDSDLHPLPRLPQQDLRELVPKAIIAVDLFGLPADYGAINSVADSEELLVFEDAAQSFGGALGNKKAGSLAAIGCTSFFPAKPLGCYGDGGALFTDDDKLAALFRSIRVHGQGNDRYENIRLGITGRLDTIQAAVLLKKLGIFDGELDRRQQVAELYTQLIIETGLDLQTPVVPEGLRSAWAQYTVTARDGAARERFRSVLAAQGIPSAIYYPKPLHLQKVFAHLAYRPGDLPVSEALSDRVFSIPMHPYIEPDTVAAIAAALKG